MKVLLLCLLFGVLTTIAHANELRGVRWNEGPNNTRIVLDLSQIPDFTYGELTDPHRIYLDLKNTTLPQPLQIAVSDSRILKGIRHAQQSGNTHRVVLDLFGLVEPNVFYLEPYGPYGHRLVIDLPSGAEVEDCSTDTEPHDDVVIVLDAGHGGEDPGAVGVNNVLEKRVALSITKTTKATLEAQDGFKVIMTRHGDYEVTLDSRRNHALRERAHLFASIHADSFTRPGPRGASVFVLDNSRAQTELDNWAEENENRSDWQGGVSSWVNSKCFDDPEQYRFLNDLASDAVLDHSVDLGKSVLESLSLVTRLHQKSLGKNNEFLVTDAGFKVLKSTQVPSILVETGFLSNPEEAKLLATPEYQARIGRAIAQGILKYFCDNPPWHTRLSEGLVECNFNNTVALYRVQKGDTLSEIALAHRVSVKSIQRANAIVRPEMIYADQLLTIPIPGTGN